MLHCQGRSIYPYLLLGIITLLAAVLRFYKLGEWSLWIDEAFELGRAQKVFEFNTVPSLTQIFIGAVIKLRGSSEWSARLAPAIIGILSIPIIFFLIRKLFGSLVGLLAVLLLAISPWHIFWSQNVRFYTLLTLMYTLGLVLVFYAIEDNNFKYALIAGILLTFAVQERMLAFFYIPVIISYVIALKLLPFGRAPGLNPKILTPLLLPVLIYGGLDLYAFIKAGPINVSRDQVAAPDGYASIDVFLKQFLNDARLNPLWMLTSIINFIGVPVACLSLFSGFYLTLKKSRKGLFLLIGVLVPLLALLLFSLLIFSNDRYVFHTLPFWLILGAVGIKEIASQMKANGKVLALGILALLLASSLLQDFQYFKYQRGYRHDWKGAFRLVQEKRAEGDLVAATYPELGLYYLGENVPDSDNLNAETVLSSCQRLWFVDGLWGPPQTLNWLRDNSALVGVYDVQTPLRNLVMRVYFHEPTALCNNT